MNRHSSEVLVEDLIEIESSGPKRWCGMVRLPGDSKPGKILIIEIAGEYLVFPALCPHQGYDVTHCPISSETLLVCPAHGRNIDARTSGLHASRRAGRFYVSPANPNENLAAASGTGMVQESQVSTLLKEIDTLTLANAKQERKIHVITGSMDSMLKEIELQKIRFMDKAVEQESLKGFIDRVMDTLNDLIFVIDQNGRIIRMNRAVEAKLGFRENELLNTAIDALLFDDDRFFLTEKLPPLPWQVQSVFLENVRLKNAYEGEHKLIHKFPENQDSMFWFKGSLLHSEQGKLEGAVITATDISEMRRRQSQLRLSAKVFDNSSEAIFITDTEANILEVNTAFCDITGYTRDEVIGQNTRILKSHMHDQLFYVQLWDSLLSRGYWRGEMWDRRKDGEICPLLTSINAVFDDKGRVTHYVAISTDISYQKQTEKELRQLAYYDGLTQLPNRSLFRDRFEQELLIAQRDKNRFALFFLDLDHFKDVNDTLGHWAGDNLLQETSLRIQNCLRKSDTVARLSGDEFAIIMPGLTNIASATELAQRLIEAIRKPIQIKNHTVYVGISIGIAMYPDDGEDFDTLTKHADTAMYASKAMGRGIFQYFEAGMNQAAHQRMLLENALRQAIEREEFLLYYQPKADCGLHRVSGAEALVRWHRPGFGMIQPDIFINVAEETGLIIPIGKWILKTACLQAKIWSGRCPGFRIAINLSPRQLMAPDFMETLRQIVEETAVEPESIELEITESMVMHDVEVAKNHLLQISQLGFSIAMDDFGVGNSSLSYLRILPINTLKIDRSFIQVYNGDPASKEAMFIKTIVTMGKLLNMTVVAEGVQTQAQLQLIQSCGCDQLQGYYLSPPVNNQQFERRWIDSGGQIIEMAC